VLIRLAELLVHGRHVALILTPLFGAASESVESEWHVPDNLVPDTKADPTSSKIEHELSMMNRRLTFTALFSTRRGWIGTGPDTVMRRDVLVRIRGLLRTCILRKVEGSDDYMLVGGCFLRDDLGVDVMGEDIMASLV
jgi:hypothetical protein